MRKGLALVFGVGLMVSLTGCGPGVVRSHDDRMNTYQAVFEMDMKQMRDDWDMVWLADREYRLTPWHIR